MTKIKAPRAAANPATGAAPQAAVPADTGAANPAGLNGPAGNNTTGADGVINTVTSAATPASGTNEAASLTESGLATGAAGSELAGSVTPAGLKGSAEDNASGAERAVGVTATVVTQTLDTNGVVASSGSEKAADRDLGAVDRDRERHFVLDAPARIRGVRRKEGETVTVNYAEWRDLVKSGCLAAEE